MLLLEEIIQDKSQLEEIFNNEKNKLFQSINTQNNNITVINKKIDSYILLIQLYNDNYSIIKTNLMKMYLDIANFKTYKDAINIIALPNKNIQLFDIDSKTDTEISLKHIDCDILNINFEPNLMTYQF